MELSNNKNIPAIMIDVLESKPYLQAGASDFSATSLVDPPQLVQLKKRYGHLVQDDAMDKLNNSYANCIQIWDNNEMINETIYDCNCEFCKSKSSYTSGLALFGVKWDYKIEVCDSCRELLTDPCFSLEQVDRIMKNVIV
jgi:hypothetical protein